MERLRDRLRGFTRTLQERASAAASAETLLDEKNLQGPLEELQTALLESDVALETAEALLAELRRELQGTRKRWGTSTGTVAEEALRGALRTILQSTPLDFDQFIAQGEKPARVVFVGVNGTGKTSTVAKIAHRLRQQGRTVVLAAGDTYRAGAQEQLDTHAQRLGLKLIQHDYGADPAAVIYDAIQYAAAHRQDAVLADTAGRAHTNTNLMDQLKKVVRVTQPHLLLFVDDATAGNDALERARRFHRDLGLHGHILTKFDTDAKGGCALSIAHATGKPLLFVATGQNYTDLQKFDPEWLIKRLLD